MGAMTTDNEIIYQRLKFTDILGALPWTMNCFLSRSKSHTIVRSNGISLTHSHPYEVLRTLYIGETLLRSSVSIEDARDLINDR